MTNVIYWPADPSPQERTGIAFLLGYRVDYVGRRKRHWLAMDPVGRPIKPRTMTQAQAWEAAWRHVQAHGGRGKWRLPLEPVRRNA